MGVIICRFLKFSIELQNISLLFRYLNDLLFKEVPKDQTFLTNKYMQMDKTNWEFSTYLDVWV